MIPFTKMHGIGNDFVMLDAVRSPLDVTDYSSLAKAMCDRRFGVGSDGLIVVERGQSAPFRMRMWNPDGSASEMCGNGIRCCALLLRDHGHTEERVVPIETGAGVLRLEIVGDGCVRVDMGPARLERGAIGMTGDPRDTFIEQPIEIRGTQFLGTAVSMGNPHLVLFVEDAEAVPLHEWGPELESHPLFPNRVNVHFVQVRSQKHLVQKTWERGAGATLACGTGACASATAGFVTGRSERCVTVSLPGGDLSIEYSTTGRVWMTGPAQTVFVGEWPT